MMNMDILMISQYFPPDWNGVSTRAYNAALSLKLQGCNVTVIAAFPHYPDGHIPTKYKRRILSLEEIDGIKLVRTWVPSFPHLPLFKRVLLHISFMLSSLLGLVHIRKVDVIFAMNPNLFAFFPALIYKVIFRKNIIRNVDDLWPEVFYDLGIVRSRIFKKILDSIANITYSIPKFIVPLSYGYVQTLTDKYHVPPEKIIVIEHGVDTMKFCRLKTNYSSFSTIGNNNNDNKNEKITTTTKTKTKTKTTIMYSGNLNLGYDFETVIRTAKLLELQPVHFIIRGIGVISDKVRQMVKEYDVKNVEVRTDLLSQEQLVFVLNSADIFLLPMNLDAKVMDQGLPTKLLEYQALGKPIVCISNGEAGKYIIETQSGLVATTSKPEELAELIMQLVKDKDLAKRLGDNGFSNINNNLTLNMVGKRLMDVIRRIG
jgi:glycosyltransferase involved in cell wall biosynthesis